MSSSGVVDPSLTYRSWNARSGGDSHVTLRQLATIVIVAAVLVWAGAYLYRTFWDPRMGAAAAGRALTARVHNGGIYKCHYIRKDMTLWFMDDVDYACNAVNKPLLSGYWIGTDRHSITEIEPNG
jgi:hypothetical protein